MLQSSEQIEAKLCAYLEGELDEQGRAEIEKHLAANPAHRRLLAEVSGTRDLLRNLPRESAPADLCETLQGHLERSVLLDDAPDEHAAVAGRIGRWRPMLAMAAMVVLAVGLGLVIYFGLPNAVPQQKVYSTTSGSRPPATPNGGQAIARSGGGENTVRALATTNPSDTPDEADVVVRGGLARGGTSPAVQPIPGQSASPTTAQESRLEVAAANTAVTGTPGSFPPLSPANPAAPAVESLPELAQRASRLWSPEQQRELFAAMGRRADGTAALASNAMFLLVSSPEPAAASEEVTQELDRLQLAWEPVTPTTATLALRQAKLHDAGETGAVADEALAKKVKEAESEGAKSESLDAEVMKRDAIASVPAPSRPAARAAGQGQGGAVVGTTSSTTGAAAPSELSDAAAGTRPEAGTRPAGPAQPIFGEADRFAADKSGNADRIAAAAEAKPQAVAPAPTPVARGERMILARNVTPQQAETLRAALAGRRAAQQVAVWTPPVDVSARMKNGAPKDERRQLAESAGAAGPVALGVEAKDENEARFSRAEPHVRQRVAIRDEGAARSAPGMVEPQAQARAGPFGGARGATGAGRAAQPAESATQPSRGRGDDQLRDLDRAVALKSATAPTDQVQRRAARGGAAAPAPAQRPAEAQRPADAPSASEYAFKPSEDLAQRQQREPAAGGVESQAAPATPLAAAQPATSPATEPVDGQSQRVDLLIVVKATESPLAAGVAPGAAGGATTGEAATSAAPVEKFEYLTVTLGDAEDGTNVQVAEDGTINLPQAGRVQAEGLTPAELGKRITEALSRANINTEATVTRPDDAAAAAPPAEAQKPEPQPEAPNGAQGESEKNEPGAVEGSPEPRPDQPANDPLPPVPATDGDRTSGPR